MSVEHSSRKIRYSTSNPPQTVEQAVIRLTQIEVDVVQIEIDLKHQQPIHYETEDDYLVWHKRASDALVHIKVEQAFLEKWKDRRLKDEQAQNLTSKKRILTDTVSLFLRQVGYSPLYSAQNLPTDIVAGKARWHDLTAGLGVVRAKSAEITASATQQELDQGSIKEILVPLGKLEQAINVEISIINKLRGVINGISNPRPNGNPELTLINASLNAMKTEMGMGTIEMMLALFDIVEANKAVIVVTPEVQGWLEKVKKYVQLSRRRKAIEGT